MQNLINKDDIGLRIFVLDTIKNNKYTKYTIIELKIYFQPKQLLRQNNR